MSQLHAPSWRIRRYRCVKQDVAAKLEGEKRRPVQRKDAIMKELYTRMVHTVHIELCELQKGTRTG